MRAGSGLPRGRRWRGRQYHREPLDAPATERLSCRSIAAPNITEGVARPRSLDVLRPRHLEADFKKPMIGVANGHRRSRRATPACSAWPAPQREGFRRPAATQIFGTDHLDGMAMGAEGMVQPGLAK
jgi:hypothetical protein